MKRLMDLLTNKKVTGAVSILCYAFFLVYIIGHFLGNENKYTVGIGYLSVALYAATLSIESIAIAFFNGEYKGTDMSSRRTQILRYTLVISRIFGVFLLYWLIVPEGPIDWVIVVWLGVQVTGNVSLHLSGYIMNKMFPESPNDILRRSGMCRPINAFQRRTFLHDGKSIDMHRIGDNRWSSDS